MGLPLIYGGESGFDISGKSPRELADSVINSIVPWGIINCNEQLAEDQEILDFLNIIVPKLKAGGYEFVTLSNMVEKRGKVLTPGNVYYSLNPESP